METFDDAMRSILEVMELGSMTVEEVQDLIHAGVAANIMHSLSCAKDHATGDCDYYTTNTISKDRKAWRLKAIEKAKELDLSVKDFGLQLQMISSMLSKHNNVDYAVLQFVLSQIALRAPKRLASQPDLFDGASSESGS